MKDKIRVGIIGVGNCASSLVQGIEFYRKATDNDLVPGLMHVELGGYHVRDIEFSAAFDIGANKVGSRPERSDFCRAQQHYPFLRCSEAGRESAPRHDA